MPPGGRTRKTAPRCLFGKPTDDSLGVELEKKLEKDLMNKSEKWGFDFTADRPLVSGEVDFEPIRLAEVPTFYHPRVHKKNANSVVEIPSTSQDTVRITRAASKRRLLNNRNESPSQKQSSIMNFVTVTKRRSGHLFDSMVTPKKIARAHSDGPDSSPFRYVSAESEKHFDSSTSPQTSPRKSPRKNVKTPKKSPPRKNLLPGRFRRHFSSIV